MFTNGVKSCCWVSYTFLQKPCSFKFFSILEENCGADLSRWVSYTFLQKRCSFKSFVGKCCKKRPLSKSYLLTNSLFFFSVFQHLKRKLCCRHYLLALLLANAVKRSRWVSYTFLQKRCSFKSFSILEENCAADINNKTFKCKTFVCKCCQKRPLSKLYLPTKALFFQFFQHFRRKVCCRHRFWNI